VLTEDKVSASISVNYHIVTKVRFLTESTFILRFTRENMQFKAGQHIIVGMKGYMDQREYSIYSGENDEYIEILVKEIITGNISVLLRQCKPGDLLQVNGPFGSFGIETYDRYSRKLVFIASGTGISPFHSFVRSYPGIDYTLLHGVSFSKEAYERNEYAADRYILCTSKEKYSGHKGRVTRFLIKFRVTQNMIFYLCGNSSMIYEVSQILREKGIPDDNIISEIYF